MNLISWHEELNKLFKSNLDKQFREDWGYEYRDTAIENIQTR